MKNISVIIAALALSAGVMAGCTEKERPAEKAKESVEEKTAASGGGDEKALRKPAASGNGAQAAAVIFKSKCSPCHGTDGNGTAMAPAFKGNSWIKGAVTGDIADVIRNGRQGSAKKYANFASGMPAFKEMSGSDLNGLAEYIKSVDRASR